MRAILPVCLLLLISGALSGCSYLGLKNPFTSDPLTGGVNASFSELLDVALPGGLQRYPSHGFINADKGGLEILRGSAGSASIALALFNTLKDAGWQMRVSLRHDSRAFYLYQKNDEYAAIVLQPQVTVTVVEIWKERALPDGAILTWKGPDDSGYNPLPAEEYGPADGSEKQVETWGTSGIQEKDL